MTRGEKVKFVLLIALAVAFAWIREPLFAGALLLAAGLLPWERLR